MGQHWTDQGLGNSYSLKEKHFKFVFPESIIIGTENISKSWILEVSSIRYCLHWEIDTDLPKAFSITNFRNPRAKLLVRYTVASKTGLHVVDQKTVRSNGERNKTWVLSNTRGDATNYNTVKIYHTSSRSERSNISLSNLYSPLVPVFETSEMNPSDFLKQITGRSVVVKLNNGSDYKGVLGCLDGYMNIVLEQTEEYINGEFKKRYGDAFIRGNNVYYISTQRRKQWLGSYLDHP